MRARKNITDRGHRYRAQKMAPAKGKRCLFCGSTRYVVPDHWDGFPDHSNPENIEHLCKSCNTAKGAAFARVGRGRLTKQYNPTRSGGAANVGEWMQAVGAIIPHKGAKYAAYNYGVTSEMSTSAAVDMIRATPQHKRREYAAKMRRHNPSKFDRCVRDVKKRGGASNAYAVCTAAGTRNPRNPAESAAAMSEKFHGRPVLEIKEVDEQFHYHTHLAELGELERLKVRALDGAIVRLEDFEGALLCSNEDGTQLFFLGGDQSVDPEEFAVEEPFHDKEELGEVIEIRYFTTKDHLGEDGGEATYYHEFGEEDKEAGRRPRRPKLIYSTRDGHLSLVGGAYRVESEGIVN